MDWFLYDNGLRHERIKCSRNNYLYSARKNLLVRTEYPEAYLEPCQASKMELFVEIVNDWKPWTIFAKSSILNILQGSKHASGISSFFQFGDI